MIQRSKFVNRYVFLNNKWSFFKEFLRETTKCYFVKNLKIDEATNTLTFKKVYKMRGVKFDSEVIMEAIWEEEQLENEEMKISVYVRERKSDE